MMAVVRPNYHYSTPDKEIVKKFAEMQFWAGKFYEKKIVNYKKMHKKLINHNKIKSS